MERKRKFSTSRILVPILIVVLVAIYLKVFSSEENAGSGESDSFDEAKLIVTTEEPPDEGEAKADWHNSIGEFLKELQKAELSNFPELYEQLSLFDDVKRGRALGIFVANWVARDSRSALEFGLKLAGRERARFMKSVVDQWPFDRLEEGFELLNITEGGDDFIAKMVERASGHDPGLASRHYDSIKDETKKGHALGVLLNRWGNLDPGAALLWVSEKFEDHEEVDRLGLKIAMSAVRSNPKWATEFLGTMEKSAERTKLLEGIVAVLMAEDVASGLEWINGLSEGDRDIALLNISDSWGKLDPAGALEYGMSLESNWQKDRFLSEVTKSWARSAPEDVLEWMNENESLNDDSDRRLGIELFDTWSESDPEEAAVRLKDVKNPKSRGGAAMMVSRSLAAKDLGAAKALVFELDGDVDAQQEAVSGVVNVWLQQDGARDEAAAWLEEMPSGLSKDRGTGALAFSVFKENPKDGMAMFMEIEDQALRLFYVKRFGSKWLASDQGAARSGLAEFGLTDEESNALGL